MLISFVRPAGGTKGARRHKGLGSYVSCSCVKTNRKRLSSYTLSAILTYAVNLEGVARGFKFVFLPNLLLQLIHLR